MTNAEARFNKSLCPRKPEGSLGRTAQDGHLDSPQLLNYENVPVVFCPNKCVLLDFLCVWISSNLHIINVPPPPPVYACAHVCVCVQYPSVRFVFAVYTYLYYVYSDQSLVMFSF